MTNKLGLCDLKLLDLEKNIVNLKLNLLDDYFTFNSNLFELEYLQNLHNYLFSDLYYEEQLKIRELSEKEKKYIQKLLKNIYNECIENKNTNKILEHICDVWYLQLFPDGNTRTLFAYLKVINDAFLLDLDIDFDKEIKSGSNIFLKESFVNQKRLTK